VLVGDRLLLPVLVDIRSKMVTVVLLRLVLQHVLELVGARSHMLIVLVG
jgi:hypothetical protein